MIGLAETTTGFDFKALRTALEDTFNVFLDDSADKTETVGDLYDHVLAELGAARSRRRSLRAPTFLALREALASHCGVPEESIALDTKMNTLLPWRKRRKRWEALQQALNWQFTDLQDPPGFVVLFAFAWLAICFSVFFLLVGYLKALEIPSLPISIVFTSGLFVGAAVLVTCAAPLLKRFAIRIPSECRTVNGMVDMVLALNRVRIRSQFPKEATSLRNEMDFAQLSGKGCANPRVFFRLRQAFSEVAGLSAEDFRLDAKLADLLPRKGRRAKWRALAEKLLWRLPPLKRPALVTGIIIVTGPALCILSMNTFSFIYIYIYYLLVFALTRPLAFRFPSEWSTVRGLVRAVLSLNYGKIVEAEGVPNAERVWEDMQWVIVEVVEYPHTVTPETRLVEDLGMRPAMRDETASLGVSGTHS